MFSTKVSLKIISYEFRLLTLINHPFISFRLIKFESLQRLCDEKSSLLSDMISVQSGDLGNALRQLRSVYMQTHHEMKSSFKNLYKDYVKCENSYADSQAKVSVIQQQLNEEEELMVLWMAS